MEKSPIVPMPEKFSVFYDRDTLVIRRKWFGPRVYLLVPVTMLWNGFVVSWFYKALNQGNMVMAAVGSIHALVGLNITYSLICSFVNATDVTVDPQNVTVKHHPFPWPGNKQIATTDITQMYCDKRVSYKKRRKSVSYAVKIIDQHGKSTNLIKGLCDVEEARFIESKVEAILGIENQAVVGEA